MPRWRKNKPFGNLGTVPWVEQVEPITTEEVIALYNAGHSGTMYDPEATEELFSNQPFPDGEKAAETFGLMGSGAGKLSLAFLPSYVNWPKMWPCPGQETGDCLAAGTIVTGQSIKKIEDVEIGESVWTGEGRLTTVISKRAIIATKPMVRIRSIGSLPITCTADHKILVYRMSRVAGRRVNRALYERVVEERGGQDHKDAVRAVEKCYESRRPEWVAAGDLTDSDCLLTPFDIGRLPLPNAPGKLTESSNGLFVLGYFLGDGYAGGTTVELMVSENALIEKLETILSDCGFKPKRERQKGCWRIRVHSTKLVKWLRRQFYDSSKVKSFPGWAVGDRDFMEGLRTADGFVRGKKNTLDSTSLSVIYGAYATLVELGYEPTISESRRSSGYVNAKPIYRLIWRDEKQKNYVWRDESFVCRPIRSLEFIEGPTVVYDIGVHDAHHSFIANGHAVANCVSHGAKNAAIVLIGAEVASGMPDPTTGVVEGFPTVSILAEQQGVVACEPPYGFRGHSGEGASCARLIDYVCRVGGIHLRKEYPELGIDLTKYTVRLGMGWGRNGTPEPINAEGKKHQIRVGADCSNHEICRDFLANLYPIWACSGFGWSNQRDANGYSKRSGSWSHSWNIIAYDDRAETVNIYGFPLGLYIHDWGKWNSGPRDIRDSAGMVPPESKADWVAKGIVNLATGNIMIPEGSMWIDARLLDRCECTAMSNFNGFPKRKVNNLLI